MNTQQLISFFGSQEKAAKAIGISQGAISQWHKSGSIPIPRQYQIQVLTDGALKVGQ